jgi:hypothetical protein
MASRNQVNIQPPSMQPSREQITADFVASGQPIEEPGPNPLAQIAGGISEAGMGILKGVGDFINTQKETPEGRYLLTNMLAGITVGLGADPQVGANLVQAGQRQYAVGLKEQQQGNLLQQKAALEAEKAAADTEQKQLERDQKLLDEQRKRQEEIEDTLYLDRMKKEQDPERARFNARTEASHKILSKFETQKNPYYKDTVKFYKDTNVPYLFKSDKFKQIEQAQRDFINAALRRESGAAIAESEFENARLQYFPQPGDTAEVVKQKQKNREMQFAKIKELKKRDPLGIL